MASNKEIVNENTYTYNTIIINVWIIKKYEQTFGIPFFWKFHYANFFLSFQVKQNGDQNLAQWYTKKLTNHWANIWSHIC